jgi:hypothetical protein
MARSVNEIWTSLVNAKAANGLPTNNSPMSVINRLLYVFALATQQFEQLLDSYKAEVIEIANSAAYGSAKWLRAKTFEFQYSTVFPQVVSFNPNTLKIGYEQTDTTLRIISACSIKQLPTRSVLVKVAKGTAPSYVPLSDDELLSLNSYYDSICPAGQNVNAVSYEGDDIYINLTLYYNAQTTQTQITNAVDAAIKNYIYGQEFDGVLIVNRIIDQAQAVDNVINAVITSCIIDNENNRGAGTPITVESELFSGYARNISITYTYVPR